MTLAIVIITSSVGVAHIGINTYYRVFMKLSTQLLSFIVKNLEANITNKVIINYKLIVMFLLLYISVS